MSIKEEVIQILERLSEQDLQVVKRMLQGLEEPAPAALPQGAEERRANARAGLGALAHLPGSVDEFLREKHEDVEREEERYRQRHPEA